MNIQKVKVLVRFSDGKVEVVPVLIDFSERLNLRNEKSWEDGEWHFYNMWDRKDGKIDSYHSIIKEGIENGLN